MVIIIILFQSIYHCYFIIIDGDNDWIDIKSIQDECLLKMKCPKGLSLSFWMKFEGGDYILTAGGYAEGMNEFISMC